jgi:cytosine/uracil/thiamine/allantoin permease
MIAQMKHGLIIGTAVGVALFAFMYVNNNSLIYLIMIPIGAVMGAAPWLLKPKEE